MAEGWGEARSSHLGVPGRSLLWAPRSARPRGLFPLRAGLKPHALPGMGGAAEIRGRELGCIPQRTPTHPSKLCSGGSPPENASPTKLGSPSPDPILRSPARSGATQSGWRGVFVQRHTILVTPSAGRGGVRGLGPDLQTLPGEAHLDSTLAGQVGQQGPQSVLRREHPDHGQRGSRRGLMRSQLGPDRLPLSGWEGIWSAWEGGGSQLCTPSRDRPHMAFPLLPLPLPAVVWLPGGGRGLGLRPSWAIILCCVPGYSCHRGLVEGDV